MKLRKLRRRRAAQAGFDGVRRARAGRQIAAAIGRMLTAPNVSWFSLTK